MPVNVEPGKITIVVEYPGKLAIQKEEEVKGGQTKTILITPAVDPAKVEPAKPPPTPPPPSSSATWSPRPCRT